MEEQARDKSGEQPTGLVSDRAALADKLGIKADVAGLVDLIRDAVEADEKAAREGKKERATPLTISVQGSWGSGKTSIMRMVQEELEGAPGIETAWVETWAYGHLADASNLPAAVMHELAVELEKSEAPTDKSGGSGLSARERFSRLSGILLSIGTDIVVPTAVAALNALVPAAAASVASAALTSTVESGKKGWRRKQEEKVEEAMAPSAAEAVALRELRTTFEDAVAETGKTWVFFIDDLDRIPPLRAVELMEAIQVFLSVKNCVFVLAIDFEVVREGVTEKYGDYMSARKARSFFDKLVQVAFDVPQSRYEFDEFLEDLLKDGRIEPALDRDGLVRYSIGRNPRAAKRLVLAHSLGKRITAARSEEAQAPDDVQGADAMQGADGDEKTDGTAPAKFAALCLQAGFPDLFDYFVAHDVGGAGDAAVKRGKGKKGVPRSDFDLLSEFAGMSEDPSEGGASEPGEGEGAVREGDVRAIPKHWPVDAADHINLALFLKEFVGLLAEAQGDEDGEAVFSENVLREALGIGGAAAVQADAPVPERPGAPAAESASLLPADFQAVFDGDDQLRPNVRLVAENLLQYLVGLGLTCKVQVNPRIWSIFSDAAQADRFGEIQLNNSSVALRFLNVRKLNLVAEEADVFANRVFEKTKAIAKEVGARVVWYPKYNVKIGVLGLKTVDQEKRFHGVVKEAAEAKRV